MTSQEIQRRNNILLKDLVSNLRLKIESMLEILRNH